VRRSLLAGLAIAVLVSVIVVERHTLAVSLHVLAHLNWAWFLLAVATEAVSLSSFALSRKLLLQVNGRRASFSSVMAITYAANALSISVPFAGAELALVYSYRQFRRHGVDAATTGWMLAMSAIFSTSALALLLAIGALLGSASLASAAGFLGAFVFIVPAATVLLALRYENVRTLLHQVIAWLVGLSRSVLGVPAQGVDGLDEFLDRVASLRLPWPGYAEVFGLAVLNWTADCAALACAIRATGQPVPWHSLLLVYGAGAAVGSTGITPGGFALVELALTAALTAAGLPRSSALAAVLAYRLVNFWMILIGGWILIAVLAHRRIAPAPDAPGSSARSPGRTARIVTTGGGAMSEQDPDEPAEFAQEFDERFHRDRREHGGEIDRLDDDQLARLTEEERVAAGVDDYDPDEVPPATDTPPQADPGQSRERQEARAEFIREYDKGELYPIDEDHPFPPTRYE
jgi:uncharacterized protein (TIRG00374 family)